MNWVLPVAWIFVLCCSVSSGQTNSLTSAVPFQACLPLKSPANLEQKPPGISLPQNANPLSDLPPAARSDTLTGAGRRPGLRAGFWEDAADAYHRQETRAPERDSGGAPSAELHSQTQLAPLQSDAFASPHPHPLKLPDRPKDVSDSTARDAFALSNHTISEGNSTEIALMRQLERQGLLQHSGPVYENDLQRKIAESFRPEIIHLGHVRISSPIITAIARKNPFCLLDPNILGISF